MAVNGYGPRKPPGGKIDTDKLDRVVADAPQAREEGQKRYQLTVHHKDHNHDNNPPDGSNWENLCLYCHDYEHQKYEEFLRGVGAHKDPDETKTTTFNPFADLKAMLDKDKD